MEKGKADLSSGLPSENVFCVFAPSPVSLKKTNKQKPNI
jgi:hypothetical protein